MQGQMRVAGLKAVQVGMEVEGYYERVKHAFQGRAAEEEN